MPKVITIDPGRSKCGLVLAEIREKKVYKAIILKSELLENYVRNLIITEDISQIILGNGTACVVGLQCADIKKGTRVFTNSGSASMGYDLPASIGSSIANKNRRIICVTGDGSIMMNLQELATINYKKLPIKIFILNNNGYHSIRQTQKNFFPDNVNGTCQLDGVGFPNFVRIGKAFGLRSFSIRGEEEVKSFLNSKYFNNDEPILIDLNINQKQDFQPKLRSKIDNKGNISTPELHDMWPFLSSKEVVENLIVNNNV